MDELLAALARNPEKFVAPFLSAGVPTLLGLAAMVCAWKDSWPVTWRRKRRTKCQDDGRSPDS